LFWRKRFVGAWTSHAESFEPCVWPRLKFPETEKYVRRNYIAF
jgi:hypothetical protein